MGKKISNWEQIIEQHRQSSKSIPEFCNEIGIHPNTFYKHRKKHGNDSRTKGSTVVEIKPSISVSADPIVIKTQKFIVSITAGYDEAQLKSVLQIIGEIE